MTAILQALLSFLISSLVKVGGLKGWLLTKILKYGGQILIDAFNSTMAFLKRAFVQKAAEKKKEEIISDPKATPDQDGKAIEDFLNSGRE